MSLDAVRAFLAAEPPREMGTPSDDGGLVRYAERVARKRDPMHALPVHHLAPIARSHERCEEAIFARDPNKAPPIFEVHHAPVQHGKTSLLQADILRTLRRNPRAWLAYAAYNQDTAVAKVYEVRQLAEGEGIRVDRNFDTATEFRTVEGGGIVCGGIVGGPWTSRGFDKVYVDDPYKTAQDAFSAAWRTSVENAFWTAIWTRRRPWTSIFVNAARWHPNDLSGVLIKRGWRYVRLPAVGDRGETLWPERWPLAELLAIRDGRPATDSTPRIDPVPAWVWASLYQGLPRPEGGKVFEPSTWPRYDELPSGPYVEAMGLDLAYGAKDRHDHSALVVGRRYEKDRRRIYLVEADDRAEGVELYGCRVAEVQVRRAGGPQLHLPRSPGDIALSWMPQVLRDDVRLAGRIACRWYTSTTEAGTAALLASYGARVDAVRAAVDKLARVQANGYQSAASEGRILVPARASQAMLNLLRSHDEFTGAEGDFDDPVDAACAMHDLLALPMTAIGEELSHLHAAGADEWQGDRGASGWGEAEVSAWD